MQVTGLSLGHSGNLWITYSKGPVYQNDTAGGDPRPDSCANEIDILHAATGRLSVFLRTGGNVLLSGATPSPDGRLLAYAESGCVTGYFNSYLQVTELSTGRNWTIGQGLARCHLVTNPSWSTDGSALLVGYAPAAAPAYTGPQGTCSAPGPERLVRLNPAAAQAGMNGSVAAAGPGCEITSVAGIAGGGVLAVEACGGQLYLSGPARLLVLDAHLRQLHRVRAAGGREQRFRRRADVRRAVEPEHRDRRAGGARAAVNPVRTGVIRVQDPAVGQADVSLGDHARQPTARICQGTSARRARGRPKAAGRESQVRIRCALSGPSTSQRVRHRSGPVMVIRPR